MGDTRVGRLIGTDMFNNRYYESTEYPNPLGRWVIHGNKKEDVSQIPAEWYVHFHFINMYLIPFYSICYSLLFHLLFVMFYETLLSFSSNPALFLQAHVASPDER